MTLKTMLTATTAALGLAVAPAALVAQETTQPEAPQAETQAPSYSDAQLETFVDAAVEVAQVQSRYLPQLQNAEDDSEVQELQAAARDEMVTAIEETDGIDVQTYAEIGQRAQSDPELNQKLTALIQDRLPAEAPAEQGDG